MADEYTVANSTDSTNIDIGKNFRSISALKDAGASEDISTRGELGLDGLSADILKKFERCKTERLPHEQRWLRQYHNYRGLYGDDTVFRDSEQSRAFVKITKTKVLAAQGQINEIIFNGNKFPISVEPTEKPDGVDEYAHLEPGNPNPKSLEEDEDDFKSVYGWDGDDKEVPPGATYHTLLGGLDDKYEGAGLVPGPAPDLTKMPEVEPAKEAARNMEKAILDQINETDGHIWLRKTILEMCMLGHGAIKGPFTVEKTLHNWEKDENTGKIVYKPKTTKAPAISWVSIWNFFPDPDAKYMEEAEFVIERHKMSRSQLRELGNRPFFRKNAISRVLDETPNYQDQWWEYKLRDAPVNVSKNRYEVLEYWGIIDKELIENTGLNINMSLDDLEEVQVNVWLCNHEIIRCVINPFTPAVIPYHSCPYEEHEYQMWGVGVAENMEDSQEIMNAFARLAIDNAAIASNLVFDIDETSLVPGQDMKVYPGKQFRRQAGSPGQAIFGIKFPNTFTDAMNVFDRFRQIADESTGLPSYSHGQTGVTSTTRTSSGLSMLMGAAALNIKGVVKNIDDFILQPLGEGYFHWNMQFNEDENIRGDLCIKARGTSGLMAKEIRSQRLMQFLQIASGNPALAPFAKFEHIMRELALSLDLDPEEVVNDPSMAAIYAQIIGAAGGMGQQGSPPGQMDTSGVGGGNIGQGQAPQPGEPGFTGNQTPPNAGQSSTSAESANA